MTNPSKQKEDVQFRFRSGHSLIDGSSIGPTGITCVLSLGLRVSYQGLCVSYHKGLRVSYPGTHVSYQWLIWLNWLNL